MSCYVQALQHFATVPSALLFELRVVLLYIFFCSIAQQLFHNKNIYFWHIFTLCWCGFTKLYRKWTNYFARIYFFRLLAFIKIVCRQNYIVIYVRLSLGAMNYVFAIEREAYFWRTGHCRTDHTLVFAVKSLSITTLMFFEVIISWQRWLVGYLHECWHFDTFLSWMNINAMAKCASTNAR